MSKWKQKSIVRRFVNEVYNKGNVEVLDELTDAGFIFHGANQTEDLEDLKLALLHVRDYWDSIFENLHFSVDDIFIDGNRVVVRILKSGTFKNNIGKTSARGKKCVIPSTEVFMIADNKVQEVWTNN